MGALSPGLPPVGSFPDHAFGEASEGKESLPLGLGESGERVTLPGDVKVINEIFASCSSSSNIIKAVQSKHAATTIDRTFQNFVSERDHDAFCHP